MPIPWSKDSLIPSNEWVMGKRYDTLRSQSGNIVVGKYTPPRSHDRLVKAQLKGSPFFNTMMNPAATIPKLLKQRMVRQRNRKAPKIFGPSSLKPRNNRPRAK